MISKDESIFSHKRLAPVPIAIKLSHVLVPKVGLILYLRWGSKNIFCSHGSRP